MTGTNVGGIIFSGGEFLFIILQGGVDMATSTIVEKISINNPKVMEEYVAAMEDSANSPVTRKEQKIKQITDPAELKQIMLRGIGKWGKK